MCTNLPCPNRLDFQSPTFQQEAVWFLTETAIAWEASLREEWNETRNEWVRFTEKLMKKIAYTSRSRAQHELRRGLRDSGRLSLSSESGTIFVDFPSTGGVGNKTPLIAPFLALRQISGIAIPKVSTRGETGGTIDILEAVGTRVNLSPRELQEQLRSQRIAFTVPSEDLAPMDDVLMQVRRQTGTMRCTPLVVASILGKKLAVGCRYLVIDVKFGPDAKFRNSEDVRRALDLFKEVWSRVQSNGKIECVVSNNYVPQGSCFGRLLSLWEASYLTTPTTNTPPGRMQMQQRLSDIVTQMTGRMSNLLNSSAGGSSTTSSTTLPAILDAQGAAKSMTNRLTKTDPDDLIQAYAEAQKIYVYKVPAKSPSRGRVCFIDMDLLDRCLGELQKQSRDRMGPDDVMESLGIIQYVGGIRLEKDVEEEVHLGENLAWVYADSPWVADRIAWVMAHKVYGICNQRRNHSGCARRKEYIRRRPGFPDLPECDVEKINESFGNSTLENLLSEDRQRGSTPRS